MNVGNITLLEVVIMSGTTARLYDLKIALAIFVKYQTFSSLFYIIEYFYFKWNVIEVVAPIQSIVYVCRKKNIILQFFALWNTVNFTIYHDGEVGLFGEVGARNFAFSDWHNPFVTKIAGHKSPKND